MTGDFHVNFDDELWVGLGTTSSSIPTSTSGLTRIFSLSDASPNFTTATVNATDYESGQGGEKQLATTIGFSMQCGINISLTDPGYRLIRRAIEGAPSGELLRFFRITPVKNGSTDDPEVVRGLAWAANWTPTNAASVVATAQFNLVGYGTPVVEPQGRGLATLTRTSNGSGLTNATYTGVPLTLLDRNGGFGGIATVVVGSGAVTSVTVTTAGRNYNVGDRLSCAVADIGTTGVAPVFTVASLVA